MKSICSIVLILCTGIVSAQSLRFERETVLDLEYGLGPDNVGIITPENNTDYPMSFGPRYFEIVGDSVIYIADVCNGKVKRFKFGGGLEVITEGNADCLNGFAIGSSGRIYVVGPSGDRDITVFANDGKLICSTQRTLTDEEGRRYGKNLLLAPDSLRAILSEADAAGVGKLTRPSIVDSTGQAFFYRQVGDNRKSVRFESDDGSHAFDVTIQDAALPDSLRGVTKVKYWAMDGTGRLYAICAASKGQPKIIRSWPNRESLVSPWDAVVLVYNRSGEFLGGLRYDYPPPFMVSYYNVAKIRPNGNIYHYQFTAEGLQVVRYRPIEED